MENKINKKDRFWLFVSQHKLLCRLCAYIQYVRMKMGFKQYIRNDIEQQFKNFKVELTNMGGYRRKIILDILYSYFRNMIEPREYFLYDFRSRNEYGRKDFVGVPRLFLFWRKLWDEKICEIYHDKYKTYQTYKKYYNRYRGMFK